MAQSIANRRRSRRTAVRTVARVECRKGGMGFGRNVAVAALDLSETGIRLVTQGRLAVGQEVEILISGGGITKAVRRLGRVIWWLALADLNGCAGIDFDKNLPFAEVQRLARPSA
jgi:hypothetical protein